VNAYELATDWGVNQGCGPMLTDAQMNAFFASLPPNSLVRFWAFQGSMAINVNTHQLDWAPLDRVFAAAAAHDQRLVVVLTGQGGGCDDGQWKDPAWYEGGFQQVYDPTGMTPLSYWDYLQQIVERYKSSPALGMWEPISEAEASTCPVQDEPNDCSGNQTCPDEVTATQALRHFFDTVGGEIHALDPAHLVEDGLISSGQCGTVNTDFVTVSESPGIDVLSYHDYSDPSDVLPGDQWNGLATRLHQAALIGKPIIGGEEGIMAGTAPGCMSDAQRVPLMLGKIEGQMQAGSSGVLVWDWMPAVAAPCDWDVAPGDPLIAALDSVPRQDPG
jgi:mannan endo-1,4-beta-mannosidase